MKRKSQTNNFTATILQLIVSERVAHRMDTNCYVWMVDFTTHINQFSVAIRKCIHRTRHHTKQTLSAVWWKLSQRVHIHILLCYLNNMLTVSLDVGGRETSECRQRQKTIALEILFIWRKPFSVSKTYCLLYYDI